MPIDFSHALNTEQIKKDNSPIGSRIGTTGGMNIGETDAPKFFNDSNFKMLGYDAFRNNDYVYDSAQSTGDWWSKAINRAINPITTSFVESFRLDKTLKELLPGEYSASTDDALKDYLKKTEELNYLYPNYDNPDAGEGFKSYFSSGARNKWSSMIESSGFMVGTALGGIAQSLALGLVTAPEGGAGAAVGAARTVENIYNAAKIGELANDYNKLNKLNKLWAQTKAFTKITSPGLQAIEGVSQFNSATTSLGAIKAVGKIIGNGAIRVQAASSEAMLEAIDGSDRFYKQQIAEEEKNLGRELTKDEKDKIQDYSADLFHARWQANVGILMVNNVLQDYNLFNTFKKLSKVGELGALTEKAASKIVYSEGLGAWTSVAKLPFKEWTMYKAKTFGGFMAKNVLSEGYEEWAQYAIDKSTNDYYTKKYNKQTVSFMDSVSSGISAALKDKEGKENFWAGAIMGGMFSGAGAVATGMHGKITGHTAEVNTTADNNAQRLNTEQERLNNLMKTELVMSPESENANLNNANNNEMHASKDPKEVENLRRQTLVNAVKTAKETGKYDVFIDKLRTKGEMSDEDFRKEFKIEDTKLKPSQEYINKIISEADDIKNDLDKLDDIYVNPHLGYQNINPIKDPEKRREEFTKYKGFEEAKTIILENLSSAKQSHENIIKNNHWFSSKGVMANDFISYTSEDGGVNRMVKINELEGSIKDNQDLIDDTLLSAKDRKEYKETNKKLNKELKLYKDLEENPNSSKHRVALFNHLKDNTLQTDNVTNREFGKTLEDKLDEAIKEVNKNKTSLKAIDLLENPNEFKLLYEKYADEYDKRYEQVQQDINDNQEEDKKEQEKKQEEKATETPFKESEVVTDPIPSEDIDNATEDLPASKETIERVANELINSKKLSEDSEKIYSVEKNKTAIDKKKIELELKAKEDAERAKNPKVFNNKKDVKKLEEQKEKEVSPLKEELKGLKKERENLLKESISNFEEIESRRKKSIDEAYSESSENLKDKGGMYRLLYEEDGKIKKIYGTNFKEIIQKIEDYFTNEKASLEGDIVDNNESKKADIERRRQEELNNIEIIGTKGTQGWFVTKTNDGVYFTSPLKDEKGINEVGYGGTKEGWRRSKFDTKDELIKEINAKYDAELAALETQKIPKTFDERIESINSRLGKLNLLGMYGDSPKIVFSFKDREESFGYLTKPIVKEGTAYRIQTLKYNVTVDEDFNILTVTSDKGKTFKYKKDEIGDSTIDIQDKEFSVDELRKTLLYKDKVEDVSPETDELDNKIAELEAKIKKIENDFNKKIESKKEEVEIKNEEEEKEEQAPLAPGENTKSAAEIGDTELKKLSEFVFTYNNNHFSDGQVFRSSAGAEYKDGKAQDVSAERTKIITVKNAILNKIRNSGKTLSDLGIHITLKRDNKEYYHDDTYFKNNEGTEKHPVLVVLTNEKGEDLYFTPKGNTTTNKTKGIIISEQLYDVEGLDIKKRIEDRIEGRRKEIAAANFSEDYVNNNPKIASYIKEEVEKEFKQLKEIKDYIRKTGKTITVTNTNISPGFLEMQEYESKNVKDIEGIKDMKIEIQVAKSSEEETLNMGTKTQTSGFVSIQPNMYEKYVLTLPNLVTKFGETIKYLMDEVISPTSETVLKQEQKDELNNRKKFLNAIFYRTTGNKKNTAEPEDYKGTDAPATSRTTGINKILLDGKNKQFSIVMHENNRTFAHLRVNVDKTLLSADEKIMTYDVVNKVLVKKEMLYSDFIKSIATIITPKNKVKKEDLKYNIVFGFNAEETYRKFQEENPISEVPKIETSKKEEEEFRKAAEGPVETKESLESVFGKPLTEDEKTESAVSLLDVNGIRDRFAAVGVDFKEGYKKIVFNNVKSDSEGSTSLRLDGLPFLERGKAVPKIAVKIKTEDGRALERVYFVDKLISRIEDSLLTEQTEPVKDIEEIPQINENRIPTSKKKRGNAPNMPRIIIKSTVLKKGITEMDIIDDLVNNNIVEKICKN